jgi:hypothetical protein
MLGWEKGVEELHEEFCSLKGLSGTIVENDLNRTRLEVWQSIRRLLE